MPKIYDYFGFTFFFYSNEHEPIHVHVVYQGAEVVFELVMENGELQNVRRRYKEGVKRLVGKNTKTAEEFVRQYAKQIVKKWVQFFVLKQPVKNISIKRRLGNA
jgi:hypothetical protein